MAKGIIAAGHELTVQAAEDVLVDGGNAFDAVIAACFAACAAEPVLASMGGGGFLLAKPAVGKPVVYDFFVQTPKQNARSELDFHPILADFGEVRQEFHIGQASIAVPGVVRGLFQVHGDLATMPMRDLVAPTLSFSRNGICINDFQSYIFDIVSPIFLHDAASRRIYAGKATETGLLSSGDCYRPVELADTLECIAIEGERLFYEGEIANRIVDASVTGGGLIGYNDLLAYNCIRRKPLDFRYRDWTGYSNPAPASGGVLVVFALKLLEQLDLSSMAPNSLEKIMALVTAMDLTQRARLNHEGHLDRLQDLLGGDTLVQYKQDIQHRAQAYRGTTHISVVDRDGNMAALTLSNGEGCGSMLADTGIMLNNMLGEQDLNPQGFFNWQPDQRMTSMMAPSLLLGPQGQHLVTGSGGSNRIRSALLQVITNVVDHAMSLEQAVISPRLHYEAGQLNVEALFNAETHSYLAAQFKHCKLWQAVNLYFGGAHSVMQQGECFSGAGDARRGGVYRTVN